MVCQLYLSKVVHGEGNGKLTPSTLVWKIPYEGLGGLQSMES